MKAKQTYFSARRADTLYNMVKDVINVYDYNTNPQFTQTDRNEKMRIFDIDSSKTCFITKSEKGVGIGDHLFEIRGYYKKTGMYGSNSEWNIIPVTFSKNSNYKIFKFDNITKNIGMDTLISDEYNMCTDEQKLIYNKVLSWREYVLSRGATLSYKLPDDIELKIECIVEKMYSTATRQQKNLLTSIHKQIKK